LAFNGGVNSETVTDSLDEFLTPRQYHTIYLLAAMMFRACDDITKFSK
jgi:hypothetical protein